MTGKRLVQKLKLTQADFDALQSAVKAAEERTNGEIALAAVGESSDYSFHELFAAVLLGAVTFAVMLPLYGPLSRMIDRLFWHVPAWYLPAAYGFGSFAVIALFFLIANIPAIDRLIIPPAVRRKAVYARAVRHFVESGVYGTKDRTGILIFISYMEHEVRILADSGIRTKIDQSEWDAIAGSVAVGVKAGNLAGALASAIKTCGDILTVHFPAKAENPNELADGLVILEAGE